MYLYPYLIMTWGIQTGVYLNKKEVSEIDSILADVQDAYNSRNHFVRCAIEFFLRMERKLLEIKEPERSEKRSRILRMENVNGKSNGD